MALQKKPLYVFETENDLGLNDVPLNRLVLVESLKTIYFYENNVGVSPNTTIQQAIEANKLKPFWNWENDGPYSGIEANNAKFWGQYRLLIRDKSPSPAFGQVNDIVFEYEGTVPPVPPEAPTNLTATDDRADGVLLTWINPLSNFNGIQIYRDGVLLKTINSTTQANYLDEEVNINQEYNYFVQAFNSVGNSASSNIATGKKILKPGCITYTVPGRYSWEVPDGVTSAEICMVGGGGGGEGDDAGNARGGYAGEVISQNVQVTPGLFIEIIVGEGGIGARGGCCNNNPGEPGQFSKFRNIIAKGGHNPNNENKGSGYSGNGAEKTTCGGTGHDGYVQHEGDGDNWGGESSGFGDGGNGGNHDGGVGSGGGGNNDAPKGGDGGRGEVRIAWAGGNTSDPSCATPDPSIITDFQASDDLSGKIQFTWSEAQGTSPITYDLYENEVRVASGIQSGYERSYTSDFMGDFFVKAINSNGSTNSNIDEGSCSVWGEEEYERYVTGVASGPCLGDNGCCGDVKCTCDDGNNYYGQGTLACYNGSPIYEDYYCCVCNTDKPELKTGDVFTGTDGNEYMVGEKQEDVYLGDTLLYSKYAIIKKR